MRLIVFTRHPTPGKSKTRLIPLLGPDGAAELQRQMIVHTFGWVQELAIESGWDVEVQFDGATTAQMESSFGRKFSYIPQSGDDLGARLQAALFKIDSPTIVIGADCPALADKHARQAGEALRAHDVVIGPAADGGYYLIGLNRPCPALFENIDWGSDRVLSQTLDLARRLQLRVAQLETLHDIDRPEDLKHLPSWMMHPDGSSQVRNGSHSVESRSTSSLSVIIPALNESAALPETLASLSAHPYVEVILSDGGSTDGTIEIAIAEGARVVHSPTGRARQMNAGAAVATGDVLIFLHADTQLPETFEEDVQTALAEADTMGGAFQLHIAAKGLRYRIVETFANLRASWLNLPYGDQAIFVPAATFRSLVGFADQPLLEDVDFIRRLRRRGHVRVCPTSVTTSARRWHSLGVVRTTLRNQGILLAACLGVSPTRLAKWYGRRVDRYQVPSQTH